MRPWRWTALTCQPVWRSASVDEVRRQTWNDARPNRRLYRAYLLKEQLWQVFAQDSAHAAISLLDRWLAWASRSRLPAFVKAARSIRNTRPGSTPASCTTCPTPASRAIVTGGQRAAALRFDDPRVQALLSALVVFRLLPHGFANRDLRPLLARLLGVAPAHMTQGRMTTTYAGCACTGSSHASPAATATRSPTSG